MKVNYLQGALLHMRRFLLLAIALTRIQEVAVSQAATNNFTKVLSQAESARKNRPVESIYLHFDKPYYAAGDTVYFKAYVTLNEQHLPTLLSEILHADLIDPNARIIQSIRLKLKQGTTYGDFELPDSLKAGHYCIRAYTRWMLNEGTGSFFNQVLSVGAAKRSPIQSTPAGSQASPGNPDIRFFPEGGEMLSGIESKVAFKATGKNGLGVKVKGIVADNEGREITRFQSVHLGMGFFYLKPERAKTYQAKLTFGDAATMTVDLPLANSSAMTLAVENGPADTSIIHVMASEQYLKQHQGEEFTLLIYSNGTSSVTREKLNSPSTDFAIDRRHIHSGIMRITLFSSRMEPVSERLLFIRNQDQLAIQVKSDKSSYRKREKVVISLDATSQVTGPAEGNFSVSVVNEDLLKIDEEKLNSILAQLLLSSEVKGFVEQPNYYFARSGEDVDANLDILLLTQGYRHFVWKEILRDAQPPLAYKAEKFLQIQGMVRNSSGAPVKNEPVTLTVATGEGPVLREITDSAGRFVFRNLEFADTMRFTISPAKSSDRVILSKYPGPAYSEGDLIDPYPELPGNMARYVDVTQADHQRKQAVRAQVLKPVLVKSKRQENEYYTLSLAGAEHADQVIHASEFRGGGLLADQLNGRLAGITFIQGVPVLSSNANFSTMGANHVTPMMVVVDGVEIDTGYSINAIPLADVATVEVLKFASSTIYGMRGGGGVMVITTKGQSGEIELDDSKDEPGLQVVVTGFYKAKEFYSPRYDPPTEPANGHDLRTTILWKPEIITGKDGRASFSLYNADLGGTYKVIVEGMDKNGALGRQIYRYQVQ